MSTGERRRAAEGRLQRQAELGREIAAVEEEGGIRLGLVGKTREEDRDVLDRARVLEGVERELEGLSAQSDLVRTCRPLADSAVLSGAAELVHHAAVSVEAPEVGEVPRAGGERNPDAAEAAFGLGRRNPDDLVCLRDGGARVGPPARPACR